jgi:trigger factor
MGSIHIAYFTQYYQNAINSQPSCHRVSLTRNAVGRTLTDPMNVAIEEISACRKRVKIEVPANRVNEAFEKLTDDFQKVARIPGFRPGHAPRTMVAKRFQKDIEDELRRTLVPTAYREAVETKNLNVVSQPEIEDLKYQKGLSLSFSTLIEVAPEFPAPIYKGLTVTVVDATVTDADVEKTVETLLEQRADFVDITDRPVQMEDFAVIAYKGEIEGKPILEIAPDARNLAGSEMFWLWVKDDMFLPKFAEQVVGQGIGEMRAVTVDFPADFPTEALRGLKATYQVEVKQIKVKNLPVLTEELAQELFKMGVEELKKQIRQDLEAQKKGNAEQQQKRQIVDQLLGAANFELPESLVQAETQETMYSIVAENQARGVPTEMLEEKKDEIYGNANKSARELVKLSFILGKVADAEKIDVSQEDISNFIMNLAYRQQTTVDKIVESIKKNGSIGQIRGRILNQKSLDFILQQAKVQ